MALIKKYPLPVLLVLACALTLVPTGNPSSAASTPLTPVISPLPIVVPQLAASDFEAARLATTCNTIAISVKTGQPISAWPEPCTPCVRAHEIAPLDLYYDQLAQTPLSSRPGQLTPPEWKALDEETWQQMVAVYPTLTTERLRYETAEANWAANKDACASILAAQRA